MERSTYEVEAEVEATHWWFVERRRLFGRLIGGLDLPPEARILDIGTSTGTNLRMLRDLGFSNYEGLDRSEDAIRWCAEKGYGKVTLGDATHLPFPDRQFDLVLATDIIEHVGDDGAALGEIRRVLKSSGHVLITVPAFQVLWGLQDDVSHHQRRYRARQLLALVDVSGLSTSTRFYFNYLLFVPILFARCIIRWSGIRMRSENELTPGFINSLLQWIFRFDVWSAPKLRPPFGVSFLVIARPKAI
jgi:SAM-dependent methyltransferase